MSTPTRRQFWLAILWLGFVQAIDWSLAIRQIGLWPGNVAALAGSVLLALVATVGVLRPNLFGGPSERTGAWWGAIGAAALGTVVLLV